MQEARQFEPGSTLGCSERERPDEIGFLARGLETTFAELQAVLRREQAFARDASHELRTPLPLMHCTLALAHAQLMMLLINNCLANALFHVGPAIAVDAMLGWRPSLQCYAANQGRGSTVAMSEAGIAAMAEAIFAKPGAAVAEAYSAPEQETLHFHSPAELCAYAARLEAEGASCVLLAVHYPDMGGHFAPTRFALDPAKCDGLSYRYVCEGWGVIRVYLRLSSGKGLDSNVGANSQQRAEKWQRHYPAFGPTDAWDWDAVGRHERRLIRVLKQVAAQEGKS